MEELPVLDDGAKKKAKVDKGLLEEESGMMSKLPEEIVVSILSFLSVEEAARLRVICRQWKELWNTMIRFTPRLKFVRKKALKAGEASSREYAKGVDQVIITKSNADDHLDQLEELTVDVPLDKSFSDDVNRWIEFGAKRRVKKLKLDFSHIDPGLHCSATFFANLTMFWLKDLFMKSLDVGDKDIDCIFANSPNLERLSVWGSRILIRFEPVSAPNLKYLAIYSCKNLERLHISNPNRNIVISCGEHCWPKEVKLSNPPHDDLSQLNPTFCFYNSFFDYDPRKPLGQPNPFVCFKKGFPNFEPYRELFGQLKRLCLKIPREVFRIDSFFFHKFFPKLSEVEHLEVVLLPSFNDPLPFGLDLLEVAPFLRDLSIQLRPYRYHKIRFRNKHFKWDEKDKPLREVVKHFWGSHQNLEVVKLVDFCGCKKEVELVLNLVKIAVSLKKIIIHFLPSECWRCLSLEQVNQYSKICQRSIQLLKTQIPPHILIVIN